MNKPKLALCDLDGLGYIVAWNFRDSQDKMSETFIEAHTKEFMQNILDTVDCDYYLGFVENGDLGSNKWNFRKEFYPEYKGNRNKNDGIKFWLPKISKYLAKEFDIKVLSDEIESDDAICTMYNRFKSDYDITIVHNDKDLMQIAMYSTESDLKFFNYRSQKLEHISQNDGFYMYFKQLLMGDSNDNIYGIPGMGVKTAELLLQNVKEKYNLKDYCDFAYYGAIIAEYIDQFRNKIPQKQLNAIIKDKTENLHRDEKKLLKDRLTAENTHFFERELHDIFDYFNIQLKLITLKDNISMDVLPNIEPIKYNSRNNGLTETDLIDI